MKIPPGHTESSVLEAMDRALAKLTRSFVFGFHTEEDIEQHARAECIKALNDGKYGPERGTLAGYFYVLIKSRLTNLKRNQWKRPHYTCKFCEDNVSGKLCGGDHCKRERAWAQTNAAKMALNKPLDIDCIADEKERAMKARSVIAEQSQYEELMAVIDENLPAELREDYLRLRDGEGIPEERRAALELCLRSILRVGPDGQE